MRAADDRDVGGDIEEHRELAQHQHATDPGQDDPEPNPAVARGGPAHDRQRHRNQAHVGVHLVIRIETVHPVGVTRAGAIGLADDERREQFGVPRAIGQLVPGQALGAGRAVEQRQGPLAQAYSSAQTTNGTLVRALFMLVWIRCAQTNPLRSKAAAPVKAPAGPT
jgi:hypothetical protein